MRTVFMGTPDFAAQSLKRMLESNIEVAGVFCQPDKAKGRGNEITFSPVKQLAIDNGIPVFQPAKMRDGEALSIIRELSPDILVVVAYGRILPDDILAVPPLGAVNVHGSLLPKYRGAAPIQWTVINGDENAGVTTMYLASAMDSGDIIYQESTPVRPFETSGELYDRLSVMGADLLIKTLRDIENGTAPRTPQNEAEATYVTMLDKTMCPLDFNAAPKEIIGRIYGLQPWPVATAELGGQTLRVFAADYGTEKTGRKPGEIVSAGENGIEIACAGGDTVRILEVQAPGKKRMKSADYLRGHKL